MRPTHRSRRRYGCSRKELVRVTDRQSPPEPQSSSAISRRRLLKGTAALGLSAAGAALLPGAALAAAPLSFARPVGLAARQESVSLTMFVWVGANQGVVPREVVADYLHDNPQVQ